MKTFNCAGCGMTVFFENDHCVKCGRRLGFLPDSMTVEALNEQPDHQWLRIVADGQSGLYRLCENEIQHHICNWMISSEDENKFCLGCRLNEVIPDLSANDNHDRWRKLELAKKRCLFTLLRLGLQIEAAVAEGCAPLRFRFLGGNAGANTSTGHQSGVITVNIAEADDDERERRRIRLHEPYRTLVGHLRHELGHFFWERLILNSPALARFRELFGDESVDYQASLQNYYQQGPAADWPQRTVTAYASAHPWEDWAETWAHYLHIYDTLETADSFALGVQMGAGTNPAKNENFDDMMKRWIPLSCALNAVNRGMGLSDLYPFVLSDVAVQKLRFVHDVITRREPAGMLAMKVSDQLQPVEC